MAAHSRYTQAFILFSMWLLYALVVIPLWGWTYWDFGDGNYLYVGRRILDGLVPYRDILAPQPPLHLIGAATSQAMGEALFGSALMGARLYALAVRVLASLMIYLCTYRLFRCSFRAIVAAAVYLMLPIGFWWSICVQSENLEIVFLLLAFWQIMQFDKRGAIIAGAASALAMHCNMTAVPYFLCNALFLAARRPRLFIWYAPVALGVWSAGALAAYAWAGEAYLDNVVLNQVGSFPREEILGYSPLIYYKNKILNEGRKILELEGAMIAAACAAIAINWFLAIRTHERRSDEYRRYEYAAWYSIGMLLSVGFVMKGGTVNYIFVLGEPAVAIFAADTIVRLIRLIFRRGQLLLLESFFRIGTARAVTLSASIVVASFAGLVIVLGWPAAWRNVGFTLGEYQVELSEEQFFSVREFIEAHSKPGDPILAPPYYAWATGRTVAAELAENFLWQIKWRNELEDQEEGEAMLKMQELARMLRARQIPVVLLDMGQTGRIPVVRDAIQNAYEPFDPAYIHSRNPMLGLFIPRGAEMHRVEFPEEMVVRP